MFEYECNQSNTRGWEVRLMLFNAMVVQVFLYGVEVGGCTISLLSCYLETSARPIEVLAMQEA